jgi:hypothetical protein
MVGNRVPGDGHEPLHLCAGDFAAPALSLPGTGRAGREEGGEREVELCQSLLDPDFPYFPVEKNLRLNMVTMIPYHQKLNARVAFSPEDEDHQEEKNVL